jgi:hypothetical protein
VDEIIKERRMYNKKEKGSFITRLIEKEARAAV